MRIALVAAGGFDRSGRERVTPALLWLVERLARHHAVSVYVLNYLDRPTHYPLLGATVHDLGRPRGLLGGYRSLAPALRRGGPFDVVHAYLALPAGLVAGLACWRLRLPMVLTLDSGELVSLPEIDYGLQGHPRQRAGVRAAVSLADRITVATAYMETLAKARGIRAAVIPIGVDLARFQPVAVRDGPPWRLLHVASLNRVKDQFTLLEAFRRILGAVPDCSLDIVGEDTLNGAVHARAHQLGVGERVIFHGFVPSDQLVRLYQNAHLFVLSSRHEAANVAALEAAACGTPVIGTRVGYLADWPFAPSVPVGDAAALAAAAIDLLNDRAARAAIARACRDWAVRHDADWTAAQFEHVYQELAGEATTRPPRLRPAR